MTVVYSTLSGNTAASAGSALSVFSTGGVLFGNVFVKPTSATALCASITETLIQVFASAGYNDANESTNSCALNAPGDSSVDGNDAELSEPAAHGGPTPTLVPGAALVDKIPNASCAAGDSLAGFSIVTDQRGFPRPDQPGGACDIGAVEAPLALPPITIAPTFTG